MVAALPVLYAAVAALALYAGSANRYFVPDACERLERILATHLVGQKLASSLLVASVCSHLRNGSPVKPLVISLHGPPGVGKTLSHYLAARAMYGLDGGGDSARLTALKGSHKIKRTIQRYIPIVKEGGAILEKVTGNPLKCPGQGCAGYKVLYGMDFTKDSREMQHAMFKEAILTHARRFPESLIVVEEYDKLDCDTRSMFRQLLSHPEVANISLGKSVVILESNLGMHEVQHLMQRAGGRQNVAFDAAYHVLKDMMCEHWSKSKCGGPLDGVKLTNAIDAYIPYFPLEHSHIKKLYEMKLHDITTQELPNMQVIWSKDIMDYLMNSVQFDGPFAIDGAKDTEGPLRRISHAIKALKEGEEKLACSKDQVIEISIHNSKSKDTLHLNISCPYVVS